MPIIIKYKTFHWNINISIDAHGKVRLSDKPKLSACDSIDVFG